MRNFILELLVEEIPAKFQAQAISDFEKLLVDEFSRLKIAYQNVRSFITPRRIIFSADLSEQSEDFCEEKKGPQTEASAQVIENFLKANKASRSDCIERNINKKNFLFLQIHHPAQDTRSLLPEIIKRSIIGLNWKKSMHWGSFSFKFIRPIRNILAVFDKKVVEFEFSEIGLQSSNKTVGHRFMSSPDFFEVTDSEDYQQKMKSNFVVIDREERRKIILDSIKQIESANAVDVIVEKDLLEEIVGLVEYPVALLCNVPQRFMKLPDEAIITPMKVHQRYFPVKKGGKLVPFFVCVANNAAEDGGSIIKHGNERVLNARLADALFFFETDLKTPLEQHLDSLKKIAFNETAILNAFKKLRPQVSCETSPSLFNRTQHMVKLYAMACEELHSRNSFINEETGKLLARAATLAKCDLATNMVREFTELQGIMGSRYAKVQGENQQVCGAIEEQYKPSAEISSEFSALFSIIDKLEMLMLFFAVDMEPTGSKDPFALRRAAINIVECIVKYKINIDLHDLLSKMFVSKYSILADYVISKEHQEHITPNSDVYAIKEKVLSFIMGRFSVILKDQSISHEIISALVKDSTDILSIHEKAQILNEAIKSPSGEALVLSYKRAQNIIENNSDENVNPSLFEKNEELALFSEINHLESQLQNISEKSGSVRFRKELDLCMQIEGTVSAFFNEVLVNSDDMAQKQNRLNMLTKIKFCRCDQASKGFIAN